MDVDGASNRADGQADDQADNTMDGNNASDSANIMDTSDDNQTGDQAEDATDSNSMANDADNTDDANTTDANMFEIITQTQTSILPHLDSIVLNPEQITSAESDSPPESPPNTPNPEQILSAESDLPPPNPPNPLELDSPDAHPQVVVEHFPHENPGAPINGTPGCSIYKSTQGALGGSVWAPFQSECDWHFAHWVKMHGPSSSAVADLLAIPNVCPFCPPFFSLLCC
jgi:hypothetical protein